MHWCCSLLRWVHSSMSQAFVRGRTWWGNRPKLSLSNGFLYALFFTPTIVRIVQLAETMWEGCIYRKGGGGSESLIRWKTGLVLWGVSQLYEKRSQRKDFDIIQSKKPWWLHSWSGWAWKLRFYFKLSKNNSVRAVHWDRAPMGARP